MSSDSVIDGLYARLTVLQHVMLRLDFALTERGLLPRRSPDQVEELTRVVGEELLEALAAVGAGQERAGKIAITATRALRRYEDMLDGLLRRSSRDLG